MSERVLMRNTQQIVHINHLKFRFGEYIDYLSETHKVSELLRYTSKAYNPIIYKLLIEIYITGYTDCS